MVIDHIGVVVRSLEPALNEWESAFGYRQSSDVLTNSRQKVRVVFLTKPGSLPVKLVEPAHASSPAFAFARRGGGLHHVCFKAASVTDETRRLQSLGARILVDPEPGEAFAGGSIAFVFAGGIAAEIIDSDDRGRSD